MALILLILSPDYLFIFAYLNLVWQMYTYYFEGYVSLIDVVCRDKGKCNIIFIAFALFASQIIVTILYILNYCQASYLVSVLTVINFAMPTVVIGSVCYLNCKFSGVPKIDAYRSRLKKINVAVMIWSLTRITRAVTSLWDLDLFLVVMFGLPTKAGLGSEVSTSAEAGPVLQLFVPMIMIVIFCTVELWPIWHVLDGNFVDVFLKQSVLMDEKDLKTPILLQQSGQLNHYPESEMQILYQMNA